MNLYEITKVIGGQVMIDGYLFSLGYEYHMYTEV